MVDVAAAAAGLVPPAHQLLTQVVALETHLRFPRLKVTTVDGVPILQVGAGARVL